MRYPNSFFKRFILMPAVTLALSPCAYSQTLEINQQLSTARTELVAGRRPANLESLLTSTCTGPSALADCEKWALDLASTVDETADPKRRDAVAAALGVILQVFHGAAVPASEDSATLAFLYGWMEDDLQHLPLAAESLKEAMDAFIKLRGPDDVKNVDSFVKLAEVQFKLGHAADAEALFLRGLGLQPSGEDTADTAYILNDLGEVYEDQGQFSKAEETLSRSLKIRQKVFGEDHPMVASTLSNLAEIYVDLGDFARAKAMLEKALAIHTKADPDGYDTAAMHINLGDLHHTLGEYAAAERDYTRALEIMRKVSGPESSEAAICLSNLSSLYNEEGLHQRALPMRLQALEIDKKIFGPDSEEVAANDNNLGTLYYDEQDYAKAQTPYEAALAIRRRMYPEDHPLVGQSLSNLAHDLILEKLYAEAEPLAREALAIREKVWGPDHLDVAHSTGDLGILYFYRHDYVKAEPLLARTLSIREKTLPPSHPDTIFARMDYARVLWQMGKHAEARDKLISANQSMMQFWSGILTAVEDQRRRSLTHRFDDLLSLSLSIAASSAAEDVRGAARLAAVAVDARKGIRSSASQEVFARIRRDQNPEAVRLLTKLAQNIEQQGGVSGPKGAAQLEKLQLEEAGIEKRLIDASGAYRDWREALDPGQVSAGLPRSSAFIDVMRYQQLDIAIGDRRGERYAAVVYASGQPPQFVALGAAAPVETAVKNLRANFANMWRICSQADGCRPGAQRVLISGDAFRSNLDHTESDCTSLFSLTMAKLRPALRGTTHLLISPDAALAEVPWDILRDPARGQYLVEQGYRISYVDSARSIVYPPAPAQPQTPAVVIAQVDYDGRQPSRPVQKAAATNPDEAVEETVAGGPVGPWKPLNGGADILRTLQSLTESRRIVPIQKLPLGSEEEVMALRRPAALVVHTHGFFRSGDPQGSIDDLDSGIVLYGANHAPEAGHDGLLTAKEAMMLNLDGTRLVALLGCDTGRGIEAGEGVQGLRHALTVAGARATLLTLWEVGDLSIARFLGEFLNRTAQGSGMTMEDALAQTELAFLHGQVPEPNSSGPNRWQHPYFWAAATLGGQNGVLDLGVRK